MEVLSLNLKVAVKPIPMLVIPMLVKVQTHCLKKLLGCPMRH